MPRKDTGTHGGRGKVGSSKKKAEKLKEKRAGRRRGSSPEAAPEVIAAK